MKCIAEICKMQNLIIAATEAEIAPFTNRHADADILITGVGVPSTIYHLLKRTHQINYDCIIQAGIAGSFNPIIQPGETVLVKQDCFADIGMEENGNYIPVFKTIWADENEPPFTMGWLTNSNGYLKEIALPFVKSITINKVSDNKLQIQQFTKQFNADIETMEGAALHYVCLQEDIPFIQIRTISNFVGERDKTKWKLKDAIENLNIELDKLYNKITDK